MEEIKGQLIMNRKESKIRMNASALEFFCKANAQTIAFCSWKDTKYCQKSCKYYREHVFQESGKEEDTYLLNQ